MPCAISLDPTSLSLFELRYNSFKPVFLCKPTPIASPPENSISQFLSDNTYPMKNHKKNGCIHDAVSKYQYQRSMYLPRALSSPRAYSKSIQSDYLWIDFHQGLAFWWLNSYEAHRKMHQYPAKLFHCSISLCSQTYRILNSNLSSKRTLLRLYLLKNYLICWC